MNWNDLLEIHFHFCSHSNRGFAFVAYSSPDEAQQAVDLFNDFEIQLGHRIGVVISKDNRVLCLRRIPLSTTRNEMLSIMSKLTPGVIQITMQDTGCNGQRAIVEYSQHQAAAKARRYLLSHKLIINGSIASVDWHTSDAESLEDTHLSTTNLFVTNFTPNLSPSHLRDLFSFAGILPIKLIKFSRCGNYAFIHYCTQQQATIAYNAALQDTFFGSLYSKGKRLYVSWAKVTKERVDDSDALTDSHFSSQNSFSSFSSFLQ